MDNSGVSHLYPDDTSCDGCEEHPAGQAAGGADGGGEGSPGGERNHNN